MSADIPATDNDFQEKVRRFLNYLDPERGNEEIEEKLRNMIAKEESRVLIDIADLRESDAKLCQEIMSRPADYLPAFDSALERTVGNISPDYAKRAKETKTRFAVGFEGDFGAHQVNPRSLNSSYVNKLVAINGIVTKCSLVRPKILKSVHYCETTKQLHQKEYRDYTSFSGLPTGSTYLTRDDDGNLLTTEYGLCEYSDSQALHLQEMPENAEVGQLPRSVDVLVTNDLVDAVKPGDRVQVVGVYKPLGTGNETSGMFRTVIIGVAVRVLAKETMTTAMTEKDIANIRRISRQKDCFDLLSASLAPSICGHNFVKKGLMLLLLGGMEKNLANGTHIRGDINMLLVGDPSVAKSQLLRYVLNVAPLAVSTTGRGSSGVGLTAAVTQDSETGERKLEAGAMVLADRGVVCIDEFDKMSDQDRVAIHEVMEQQTVTIAKAGIHTSLNARCSVVAAANPVYGSYNRQKKTTENIGLPDSLLSRFDLLFILLDNVEEGHDKRISDHILRMHRMQGLDSQEAADEIEAAEDKEDADEDETPIFEKRTSAAHGQRGKEGPLVTQAFLKKYLRYARRTKPRLSEEASERISQLYMDLRGSNDVAGGALPITPRSLETIIRLSTAHAKCRLSGLVEMRDVEAAHDVLLFALSNETRRMQEESESEEDTSGNTTSGDEDEDGDDNDGRGGGAAGGKEKRKRGRQQEKQDEEKEEEKEEEEKEEEEQANPQPAARKRGRKAEQEKVEVDTNSDRYASFCRAVTRFFKEELKSEQTGRESAGVEEVVKFARKTMEVEVTDKEARAMIAKMHEESKIYEGEDTIYLV